MTRFDNLTGGSRRRLTAMRNYADRWNAEPSHRTGIEWRGARRHGTGSIAVYAHGPRPFPDGSAANIPASVLDGLRDTGTAHDLAPCIVPHTGWYTDVDCSEKIAGHVWQLPARGGTPCYLAGYTEPANGYAVLSCTDGRLDTFDDPTDAARAADALAERQAESEREYSHQWQAARDVCDALDTARAQLRETRIMTRGWVRVLRDLAPGSPSRSTVCAAIRAGREAMAGHLEAIAEHRDALAEYAAQGIEV